MVLEAAWPLRQEEKFLEEGARKAENVSQHNCLRKTIYSLKNQAAFDAVNAKGRKYRGQNFLIVYSPLSVLPKDQFLHHADYLGFKLSRKVGKAVKRNLLRRRIKFLLRTHNPATCYGYIFIGKPGLCDLNFEELKSIMVQFLQKLKTTPPIGF